MERLFLHRRRKDVHDDVRDSDKDRDYQGTNSHPGGPSCQPERLSCQAERISCQRSISFCFPPVGLSALELFGCFERQFWCECEEEAGLSPLSRPQRLSVLLFGPLLPSAHEAAKAVYNLCGPPGRTARHLVPFHVSFGGYGLWLLGESSAFALRNGLKGALYPCLFPALLLAGPSEKVAFQATVFQNRLGRGHTSILRHEAGKATPTYRVGVGKARS